MEFRTPLTLSPAEQKISYDHKILLLGSCFTEHIGNWLENAYFDVLVNPFGVIFNPVSVAQSLRTLLNGRIYTDADLFFHNGRYGSFDHHSRFSDSDPREALTRINEACGKAAVQLRRANTLLITFGTSWIYTLKEENRVVANCHKLPDNRFERRRLSTAEITASWDELITELREANPKLRILFTVSPIRHLKDTLHGNQLSKAVLLLAVDELISKHPCCAYFPAYELVLDELRDYRFYDEDMVHPAPVTIRYIRERFAEVYFSEETRKQLTWCEKLNKSIHHRPQDPYSEAYKCFLLQNIRKTEELMDKNHFFTLERPLSILRDRLREIQEKI